MLSLKLALRTLKRFRLYTLINAASLVLSLVCVLSLSRYIYRECTIDSELPDIEKVFLTSLDAFCTGKGLPVKPLRQSYVPNLDASNGPIDEVLSNERVVCQSFYIAGNYTDEIQLTEGQPRLSPLKLLNADSTFFQIVQFKKLHGSLSLKNENDALIMSDVAQKIFGTTNVIGRTWKTKDDKLKTVIGVIQRPHCKTSFDFDLVYNVMDIKYASIVKLCEASDSLFFNKKYEEQFQKDIQKIDDGKGGFSMAIRQHLTSMEDYRNHNVLEDAKQLRVYIIMVILFVIIGTFNYLNLHSVIMHRRKRDIQIKTIFGAGKKKIFKELFMEHFLILTAILPFIWLLVYLARNPLNELFNIPLESDIRFDIGLTLTIPLGLGLFFALFSFVQIHQQTHDSSETSVVPAARRSSYARIAFLFVQYMITFCLIVFALYLNHHVYYLFHHERGYRTDNILYFNIYSNLPQGGGNALTFNMLGFNATHQQNMAREFERIIKSSPYFDDVVFGERPYDYYPDNQFVTEAGKPIQAASHHATQHWMDFFQVRFVHGRNWTDIEKTQVGGGHNDDLPQNADNTYKFIVNEALWNQLDSDKRNQPFLMNKKGNFNIGDSCIRVEIVGVLQDFSLSKLTNKPEPLIFYLEGEKGYYKKLMFVAVKPEHKEKAIHYLKATHQRLFPDYPFDYKWLDDDLYKIHQEDFNAVKSVSVFAIIAILISCLGLFGISLYDIRGRYREIALRKVNGAHNKDIYRILIRKYALAMLGAALIASPFAYWGVTIYMSEVGNRAPLTFWIFLGALLILALVSLLTLIAQVHRAVHISPAEVMKTE